MAIISVGKSGVTFSWENSSEPLAEFSLENPMVEAFRCSQVAFDNCGDLAYRILGTERLTQTIVAEVHRTKNKKGCVVTRGKRRPTLKQVKAAIAKRQPEDISEYVPGDSGVDESAVTVQSVLVQVKSRITNRKNVAPKRSRPTLAELKDRVATRHSEQAAANAVEPVVETGEAGADGEVDKPIVRKRSRAEIFKEMKESIRIQQARSHAEQTIRSLGPYACMLSVNFAHPYESDAFLLDCMNRFLVMLNGALFNRQYRKKVNRVYLRGICRAEECKKPGPFYDLLHFHFLFKPCSKFDEKDVEAVLWPKVQRVLSKFRDADGRLMTKTTGENRTVDITPFYEGSLDSYLSKTFEEWGKEADDLCGVLGPEDIGIQGIKNRQRKKTFRQVFEF